MERIGNFICEAVPAPGVGNFVLGTPVPGRLPWSAGVAAGYFVYPMLVMYIANDTTKQEWGYGTLTATGLSRDTVLWTSAGSTAKINFATSPVYVYSEIPAERTVYRDPTTGRLIATYDISSPTQNMGPLAGHRNRLINSSFLVNQRAIPNVANSAAFQYTLMDRWRTGQNGTTGTWTTTKPAATVTITVGTMQQVIEGNFIEGGTYTLSWQGTATARVNSGAYSASPLVVTGIVAGANTTIEFNTGTVLKPQFEPGDVASQWEVRLNEAAICERYMVVGQFTVGNGYATAGSNNYWTIYLPTAMRAVPTVSLFTTTNTNVQGVSAVQFSAREFYVSAATVAIGAWLCSSGYVATAEL